MFQFPTIRILALGLSAALVVPLAAQEAPEEPDPEARAAAEAQGFRLPPQLRQVEYRDANPWVLHANVRYSNTESTVTFGGLGGVPSIRNVPGADITDVTRVYDDGAVILDGPRAGEVDADGNQTSTPGGRYDTFDSETDEQTGDLLAYTPGQSREWGYYNPSQSSSGQMTMNTFSSESTGASFDRDADGSGLGFDLSVARRVLKLGRRTEISISGTVGLTDFKSSVNERITADLITMSDVYEVYGDITGLPFSFPSSEEIVEFDDIGNAISSYDYETTVPIQQVTPDRTYTTVANGANVDGAWEISGAYYSIRLGPEIRTHLTKKLAVSVGGGVMGAYVGSDFTATEVLDLEDYGLVDPVGFSQTDNLKEMIVGYYASASFEYWFTQRTGMFLGASFEAIDDFVQTLGGRTASVVLGDSLVVRFGVVTRF